MPKPGGDGGMVLPDESFAELGKPQRTAFSLCISHTTYHQGEVYFFLYSQAQSGISP